MPRGASRAAKFLEIAKLATERVKKPEVCIDLWQEVLANDEANAEALGALAGLYERAKDFEKLATVLEQQAEVTYDAPAKIQVLTKLGTIYGERLNNDEGAVNAWRMLLTLDPNDRRAQDALKKKYLALGRWDDLEVFYAESGKWDEFIRVLEQQEAKETERAAEDLPPLQDRSALGRQEAEARSRGEGLREGPRARGRQPAGGRSAHPDLHRRGQRQGARKRDRGQARPRAGSRRQARSSSARRPSSTRARSAIPRRRSTATGPRSSSSRATNRRARISSARPRSPGRWDEVVAAFRAGDRRPPTRTAIAASASCCACGSAASSSRALRRSTRRSRCTAPSTRRTERTPSRSPRSSGCTGRRRGSGSSSASTRRSAIYRRPRTRRRRSTPRSRGSTRTRSRTSIARSTPTSRCSRTSRATSQALAALDVLYGRLGRWEPYVDVLRRRIELDVGEKELVDLKFRLGADPREAPRRRRRVRSRTTARSSSSISRTRARARALEAMLEGELRSDAAQILESIYEERGDWPKLIHALEILSGAEGDLEKRVALKRKAARISAERVNDPGHAFAVLASALRDDPALAETRDEIERIAEGSGAQHELVALYGELAASLTDALLARDYWMRIAGIDDRLGDVDRAAQAYYRVLALDPGDAEALSCARAALHAYAALAGSHRRRRASHRADQRRARSRGPLRRHGADLRRAARLVPTTPLQRTRRCSSSSPAAIGRSARSTISSRARRCGRELAENLEAQLALAAEDEAQLALMLRLSALRERRDGSRRRGHRGVPPGARARADEPAGSRRPRAPRSRREVRAHDRRSPRAAVPARRRLAKAHRRRTKCRSVEARTSLDASSSSTRSPNSTRTRRASSRPPSPRSRAR